MFKKLRQKIEDGGENGLEKVSFSPTKLPGSIVRSNLPRNGERIHSSPELDLAPNEATHLVSSPSEIVLERDEQVK